MEKRKVENRLSLLNHIKVNNISLFPASPPFHIYVYMYARIITITATTKKATTTTIDWGCE